MRARPLHTVIPAKAGMTGSTNYSPSTSDLCVRSSRLERPLDTVIPAKAGTHDKVQRNRYERLGASFPCLCHNAFLCLSWIPSVFPVRDALRRRDDDFIGACDSRS